MASNPLLSVPIIAHSHHKTGRPTYMILNPGAECVLEAGAYALDGDSRGGINLAAYHPEAHFKQSFHPGQLSAWDTEAKQSIKGIRMSKKLASTPVADCNPNDGKKSVQITLGATADNISKLLYGAMQLEAGRQVLLWTDGTELLVLPLG